tara:strand:- start:487 stop:1308 length:822 start_codon:yes stop_codon:yes gene_type:complete
MSNDVSIDEEFEQIMKAHLPTVDLESLKPEAGSLEDMQLRLDATEQSIKELTGALKETVSLYKMAKEEAAMLKAAHVSAKASAADTTKKLAIDLMSMFAINYSALVDNMLESGVIDSKQIIESIKTRMESESETKRFRQKVIESIKESLNIDYEDMEIEYSELVDHLSYDDLAYNICYSSLADYVSFDPTDHWDSSDLAQWFGADDIAEYIDNEDVAGHLDADDIASELDLDEIAGKISVESLATEIDLDELALFMSQNIDLDDLAQRLRGDE